MPPMAMMRCPQCGTEFEKGSVEFCPNPNCGYPVSFLEEAQEEQRAEAEGHGIGHRREVGWIEDIAVDVEKYPLCRPGGFSNRI